MLTILSVAYPLAPIGPDAVGGAEQVLTQIDAALVRAGHRSLVIACEGSRCAGELLATPRISGPLTEQTRALAQARQRLAIELALRRLRVDVVHMHGLDFHTYLPAAGVPVLATLHLPPEWYPRAAYFPARPGTFLHCVSRAQREACPPGAPLDLVAVDLRIAVNAVGEIVGKTTTEDLLDSIFSQFCIGK